ncbi:MAG TPA: hypothetical protein RMH99_21645 [Sandaracinaceae bacterium LLY-WYZ-13_1]|nr:hypothetical protein [Sandaracinaceae bacterium LLY-WYZ-13_1]
MDTTVKQIDSGASPHGASGQTDLAGGTAVEATSPPARVSERDGPPE